MAGQSPVLAGVLTYLAIAVAPTLLFWLGIRVIPAAVTGISERRKVQRARSVPAGPAIEAAVANLRRLRRELRGREQPNRVRHLALLAAYDATLLEVCRCVGVEAALATAGDSDRDFARLLTEAALEDAGIALDPPQGGAAAA